MVIHKLQFVKHRFWIMLHAYVGIHMVIRVARFIFKNRDSDRK